MTLGSGQLGFNSILSHWFVCFIIQAQNQGYGWACPNITSSVICWSMWRCWTESYRISLIWGSNKDIQEEFQWGPSISSVAEDRALKPKQRVIAVKDAWTKVSSVWLTGTHYRFHTKLLLLFLLFICLIFLAMLLKFALFWVGGWKGREQRGGEREMNEFGMYDVKSTKESKTV